MRWLLLGWGLLTGLGGAANVTAGPPAPAGVEDRVDAILARLTIEEKVGQLQQVSADIPPGPARDDVVAAIRRGQVGSVFDIHGARAVNALQRVAIGESRLKIPILFGYDVIHGYRTVVPVPLALASSWDPGVGEAAARVAAAETYAAGVRWTFAPMVDVARDPRWGRMVEGAGEDPFLGSAMARAQVRGFQGDDFGGPGRVAACVKHWVAYGAVEGGREYNSANVSERMLRTTYFPPFFAAKEAGVATFMSALNTIDGVPATANPFTLGTVLRGEWKFDGLVVADFKAVEQLVPHGLASDSAAAARLALMAGVDIEEKSLTYRDHLPELVRRQVVPLDRLDEAVRRVLRLKFRLGLFENPLADEGAEATAYLTPAAVAAARNLAGRSLVLLRNEANLLPIKPTVRSIAVIGPFAADPLNLLGPWHGAGRDVDAVTILDGIRAEAGRRPGPVTITTAQGCDPVENKEEIAAAVEVARRAELAVVVVGEPWTMSGEATSRSSLGLPGRQHDLVAAIQRVGTPVVVVLMNGRALTTDWEALGVSAVLEAWFPGVQGGPAIADALFGVTNPGGKLPITFPRAAGAIPWHYDHRNTGRPPAPTDKYTSKYIDLPLTPLYPFGHGLSYTRFEIGPPVLSSPTLPPDGRLTVSVGVRNVGDRAGDEVVQVYVQDVAASVARPIEELRGFERVALAPGEARKLRFELGPRELGFYNQAMSYIVEPGEFRVKVGSSSDRGQVATFHVVADHGK